MTQNNLASADHVNMYVWPRQVIEQEVATSPKFITRDEIDDILNGQADLLDRPEEQATMQNLLERYGLEGQEVYGRQMDIFEKDNGKMIPDSELENGSNRLVQIETWNDPHDDYDGVGQKYTHHFAVYLPGEDDDIMHFEQDWVDYNQ